MPPGKGLGWDFHNDDQMRRRLRKCPGPAKREEGHGKDQDTEKCVAAVSLHAAVPTLGYGE